MFPRLPTRATFVADTNFVSETQKMFLILFRNILCPPQKFASLRSMETQHSICVPRVCAPKKHHELQCVLVYQDLNVSGREKYTRERPCDARRACPPSFARERVFHAPFYLSLACSIGVIGTLIGTSVALFPRVLRALQGPISALNNTFCSMYSVTEIRDLLAV